MKDIQSSHVSTMKALSDAQIVLRYAAWPVGLIMDSIVLEVYSATCTPSWSVRTACKDRFASGVRIRRITAGDWTLHWVIRR